MPRASIAASTSTRSCVVIGWALKHEGRKHVVGTAIFDNFGELCGRALATWIEPRPA